MMARNGTLLGWAMTLLCSVALAEDKPASRPYENRLTRIVNPKGFWELPIPVVKPIEDDPDDIMIYDAEGYPALKEFLKGNGIRHILLTGYCADMCYKGTTAGYMNVSPDFNVLLVADATLATFPSNDSPRFATNATISYAALDHLVTQVSWVKYHPRKGTSPPGN